MNTNKTQPVTYKPFATNRQCREWLVKNCGSCKKGWEERYLRFHCDWERALSVAMVDDGKVTEKVAKAIGMLDNEGCDLWECPGWERR